MASPGMEMVAVDFGQFEMRLGAHYSGDKNLTRIFLEGLDPHLDTAMRAFNITDPAKVDKILHRAPCKNVNFGVFYGLTDEGLYDQMLVTYATAGMPIPDWLDRAWCAKFIDSWFHDLYPGVLGYLESQHYRAFKYGIVWTLLGRVRWVPETQSVHPRVVAAGLRQAGNHPIQGTQADLNRISLAEQQEKVHEFVRAEGVWCWPLNNVHDESLAEVEEGYGEVVCGLMEEVMGRCATDRETGENRLTVPIEAEGKVMKRWQK